jgi:Chaperone of endosialidase/Domain of unknown function (DUF5011)
MDGPTSLHPVGGDQNIFTYLSGGSQSVAQGTDTSGVIGGVYNTILHLDDANATPIPAAGTGSQWGYQTDVAIAGSSVSQASAVFPSLGVAGNSTLGAVTVSGFVNTGASGGYEQAGNLILYASSTNSATCVGISSCGSDTTSNSTANYDTAVGRFSLQNENGGAHNSGFGYFSLNANVTGLNNTAIGYASLVIGSSTAFTGNTALGFQAGEYASTTGLTAIGLGAGAGSASGYVTGAYNTVLGYESGFNLTSGADNTFLGASTIAASENQVTTGSQNISIGYNVAVPSQTGTGQLDIGNYIYGSGLTGTGATVSAGAIGIGTTTPYSKLEVWGPNTASTSAFAVVNSASTTEFTVYDTGNATLAGSLVQNSDVRLKTDIQDLDGSSSLAEINALNPVTFNWIDPEKSSVPQFGFIAQQVQLVFPNLISTTSPTALTPDGTLSLNYIDLISPIVAAIQELDKEITSLASTVAGFARSITSAIGNFGQVNAANELCVGSTCVTPAQFQAMVAAANQPATAPASPSSSPSDASDTPPVIAINGDNPAVIQVGASYTDLGATITGPLADLNFGIQTYLNGTLENPIELDTSAAATDTIDYVVTDGQGLTSTSTRTVIVEPTANPPTEPSAATSSPATSTVQ